MESRDVTYCGKPVRVYEGRYDEVIEAEAKRGTGVLMEWRKGGEPFGEIGTWKRRRNVIGDLGPIRYLYGLRHGDDWDWPVTLERVVVVNRWALLVADRPLLRKKEWVNLGDAIRHRFHGD